MSASPRHLAERYRLEGLAVSNGAVLYGVSRNGVLAYLEGDANGRPVILDRKGREQALNFASGRYQHPRLSPKGDRVVIERNENGQSDIWILTRATGQTLRLTRDGANGSPEWSADGRRVGWLRSDSTGASLVWQRADGSGSPEQIHLPGIPLQFVPGGKYIVAVIGSAFRHDIALITIDGSAAPRMPANALAIGSNRLFTAVTAGVAVDDGKLNLTAPVTTYLPSFQMYDPFAAFNTRREVTATGRLALEGNSCGRADASTRRWSQADRRYRRDARRGTRRVGGAHDVRGAGLALTLDVEACAPSGGRVAGARACGVVLVGHAAVACGRLQSAGESQDSRGEERWAVSEALPGSRQAPLLVRLDARCRVDKPGARFRVRAPVQPYGMAILVDVPIGERERWRTVGQCAHLRDRRVPVVRVDERQKAIGQELLRGVAECALKGRVHHYEPRVGTGEAHQVDTVIEEPLEVDDRMLTRRCERQAHTARMAVLGAGGERLAATGTLLGHPVLLFDRPLKVHLNAMEGKRLH